MQPPRALLDALTGPTAAAALRDLDCAGELTAIIPELEAGRGFVQPERHFYDVLDHNLAAVAAIDAVLSDGEDREELIRHLGWVDINASLDREIEGTPLTALIRLACLLHDVAKPHNAVRDEDGRLRFPRHGPRGSELMAERLPAVGFGAESTRLIAALIRYHLRPGELVKAWPPSDRAVRRFVSDVEGHVLPLLLVNLADGMATRGPAYTRENYRRHCGFINYILARSWAVAGEGEPPLVTGDELQAELGLESGRLLGAVLTSVRRAQAEGLVSGREEALQLARVALASLQAGAGQPGPRPE